MRIGLYGLPCAGKTYILDKLNFVKVIHGSETMKKWFPDFDKSDNERKERIREQFAKRLGREPEFIMDGHFAFGDTVVFTESDGKLYDVFIYLYINPHILYERMSASKKNQKYLDADIELWQRNEINGLRMYCHQQNKDFYVLDNPILGYFEDVTEPVEFIRTVFHGFSCVEYARSCTEKILGESFGCDDVTLSDGDKTISEKDTCCEVFNYVTNLFDGNFYTGYQTWKNAANIQKIKQKFMAESIWSVSSLEINNKIVEDLGSNAYILTCGCGAIWERIGKKLRMHVLCGSQMSAETKYYIAKFLHASGKHVKAFGDSMSDYYMLKEADEGFLVLKSDGTISRSLKNINLEGLQFVRIGENG